MCVSLGNKYSCSQYEFCERKRETCASNAERTQANRNATIRKRPTINSYTRVKQNYVSPVLRQTKVRLRRCRNDVVDVGSVTTSSFPAARPGPI